jgi:ubiquitin carboxyl-terminal hydrolase 7
LITSIFFLDLTFSPHIRLSRNILCFPRGNNQKVEQFSLYLAVPDQDADQLDGWQRSASFKLSVIDQHNPEAPLIKDARHLFTENANDWGFTAFCSLPELEDPTRGFIVDDTIKIKVEVTVTPPDEGPVYNSRELTGFVGLRNQGATCYMNSLLQTLYSVNAFRKAVYHMPTEEDEEPSGCMPLALQSVFYKLQFTPGPVSTEDLTSSFGWDTADAFQQHDVQELNRILCDRLETNMKGTRVEGTVNRLFEGHTLNYIDCINIEYKSSRKEAFQDLQLDVKGCNTIYDSFDKYCEVETLEGDNKYEAEGHGKQDARKGVLFENLPPVLNLHLKRFEYDYQKDAMVKINDKYEFFDELDLDNRVNEDGKTSTYLSPNADKTVKNKYKLLAVLVHSGGVHGGHYYAFVRPEGKKWLKFDDETVSISDDSKAVKENWGGDLDGPAPFGTVPAVRSFSKFSNAYMLVYVRESEWDSVMCEVTEEDISEHVRARLKAEEEAKAKRRKERAEAHLYTLVRIATDEDLKKQIGKTTFFDLVDFDQVALQFKLSKMKDTFAEVQKLIEERLGLAVADQRYWRWQKRTNETFRPFEPLPDDVVDKSINSVYMAHTQSKKSVKVGEMVKFDLYLEEPPPEKGKLPYSKEMILCFFKHYIPGDATQSPQLEYAGKALVSPTTPFGKLHPILRKRAGLPADEEIEVYEEVKFDPTVIVELTKPDTTLASSKLENGDILIVQSATTPAECQFASATEFMQHVRNRVIVTFKRIEGTNVVDNDEKEPEEDSTVQLELLKDMKWEEVTGALATKLGLDHPLKIRLTLQSLYTAMPRPQPQRYSPDWTLEDLLRTHGQIPKSPVLYYEPIDLPLPEFEKIVTYRVAFHNSKHEETTAVTVRVGKDKTIEEMLEEVRTHLPADSHKGQPLRLMEIWNWRIWHVFDPKQRVEETLARTGNATPWHLRCEIIPEDQRDLEEEDKLHVHCVQVEDKDKVLTKNAFAFSDPFIMAVGPAETVGELKARVQAEMKIPKKEFENWRVVMVSGMNNNQEFLDENLVIADKFNVEDLSSTKLYGHTERAMLGFHHENKNPRRTHAHINRSSALVTQERALKIRA